MEFDLQNILVLLFFLFPLIKRFFEKKQPEIQEPETVSRMPTPADEKQAQVDWEKELERLFGVPAEPRREEEIHYEEPAPLPKPVPRPMTSPKPKPAIIEREMAVRKETVREEFTEVRKPEPLAAYENQSRSESKSDAFHYHAPETLHALGHKPAQVTAKKRAHPIAAMLKDRKQIQQAVILSEILNRRGGKSNVS